ncbi:MAG: GPW/gp25 family protein [Candidatus Nanopelagicales bacterium]|jgi:uncharacterized protein
MATKDFVGEGIAYPLRLDSTGRLALVGGVENVERSMQLILGTAYGERPMRPDFGCGIHNLVFEAASVELISRIQTLVISSLLRWETRADILAVDVKFEGDNTMANITVKYRLKDSYDVRNLLVPFYLIPRDVES